MPIKAKPVNRERAALAARGALSSAGVAYAEQQAKKREQQRKWAQEEAEDDVMDDGNDDDSAMSPGRMMGSVSPAAGNSAFRSEETCVDADNEAAVLAAAQARTRRFLSAGNDVVCGARDGPSASMQRLVAYEAAKRQEAWRATEEAVNASNGVSQQVSVEPSAAQGPHAPPPSTTNAGTVTPPMAPVTVGDVLAGLKPGESKVHTKVAEVPHDISNAVEASNSSASPPAKTEEAPVVVCEAVRRSSSTHADPLRADFEKLMSMLADDVQKDHAAAARTARRSTAGDVNEEGHGRLASTRSSGATTGGRTGVGYRPAPRTFSQLQSDMLQELYEDWREAQEDEDAGGAALPFVASEHEAEAFALAAAATATSRVDSARDHAAVQDAPLSIEEIVAVEAAVRNAAKPSLLLAGPLTKTSHGLDHLPSDQYAGFSARGLAAAAQRKLSRFAQCVAWTERLVRDPAFVRAVAAFLYEHHRTFLPHATGAAQMADTRTGLQSGGSDGGEQEHSHEEFAVYEAFGTRVSEVLLNVLADHVSGFNEEEFVETLFDSPEEGYASEEATFSAAAHHVLSYPAWRIILGMSSFESFFTWMMDYIEEEYQLGQDPVREEAVVAVGGARGLRALIHSTYHRSVSPRPTAPADGAAPLAVGEGADAGPPLNADQVHGKTCEDVLSRAAGPVPTRPSLPPRPPTPPVHLSLASSGSAPPSGSSPSSSFLDHLGSAIPAEESALTAAGERQAPLGHQPKRLFPTPPSSAGSDASLRPRNSRLGLGRGKRPVALATRDLPPLTGTPPPSSPLDASALAGGAQRPASQPPMSTETSQSLSVTAPGRIGAPPSGNRTLDARTRTHRTESGTSVAALASASVGEARGRTSSTVSRGRQRSASRTEAAGSSSRSHSTTTRTASTTRKAAPGGLAGASGQRKLGIGGNKPKLKRTA